MYYRGAQAAIVVFDSTNRGSFEGAKTWVKELQRRAPPELIIALAGNKSDLASARKVDADEAREYAQSVGAFFVETSAKADSGVSEIFTQVAQRVPRKSQEKKPADSVSLTAAATPATAAKGCGCS
jgi:GTPase SAR1 family protein